MKLSPVIATAALFLSFASAAAFAQTMPAKPAPAKPAMGQPMTKESISKACSTQADSKGLHGAERKKFRAACKKNGGKA
jgi:hypothetical protein